MLLRLRIRDYDGGHSLDLIYISCNCGEAEAADIRD
jgi:hypothetical protein